mmetsp:Transcript_10178/g.21762  ORF Transcript_10178/g.21762 Transcript_10178/m.21762 type:complete len:260 (+) Transcript_10178:329-1108(+)
MCPAPWRISGPGCRAARSLATGLRALWWWLATALTAAPSRSRCRLSGARGTSSSCAACSVRAGLCATTSTSRCHGPCTLRGWTESTSSARRWSTQRVRPWRASCRACARQVRGVVSMASWCDPCLGSAAACCASWAPCPWSTWTSSPPTWRWWRRVRRCGWCCWTLTCWHVRGRSSGVLVHPCTCPWRHWPAGRGPELTARQTATLWGSSSTSSCTRTSPPTPTYWRLLWLRVPAPPRCCPRWLRPRQRVLACSGARLR